MSELGFFLMGISALLLIGWIVVKLGKTNELLETLRDLIKQ